MPPDPLQLRDATLADIPQLCELLGILFTQESDFTPDAAKQTAGLQLIIEQPDAGRIFCAVDGGAVVGMVSILFTVSTAKGARAAWLEDMVVDLQRRGQGIGRRLLDHAIEQARAAGCKRITVLTGHDNAAAMRFYARAGFARSDMVPLRLQLDA